MNYNLAFIGKMDLTVGIYQIFKQHGHGVVESPLEDGEIVRTLECSQFDAWIISESMNIHAWGIISKRHSWETPMFGYRRVQAESLVPKEQFLFDVFDENGKPTKEYADFVEEQMKKQLEKYGQ